MLLALIFGILGLIEDKIVKRFNALFLFFIINKIEEIKNEMKDETDEEVYNILEDSKKSKKKK